MTSAVKKVVISTWPADHHCPVDGGCVRPLPHNWCYISICALYKSQLGNFHNVIMIGWLAKCLPHHCDRISTPHVLGHVRRRTESCWLSSNTSNLPLLRCNEQWEQSKMFRLDTCAHIDDSLTSVTFTVIRRESISWPIFVQMQIYHSVAGIHKWQMFVLCTSPGNAAKDIRLQAQRTQFSFKINVSTAQGMSYAADLRLLLAFGNPPKICPSVPLVPCPGYPGVRIGVPKQSSR
jgi:hypothetical protein